MSNPSSDDEQPLDPAAARMIAKVRWLMLISGITTLVAITAVIGVIGYRVFRSEGSVAAVDVTALLPKGARIVATAVAEDRIAVTLDVGGATEIRTFDLKSLKPTGRLRFATEP
jgi:propanediol dehydratase large subunit